MNVYKDFFKTFVMLSAITSAISTITIEIRRSIHKSKQPAFKSDKNYFSNLVNRFIYDLRILPYRFSNYFNILNQNNEVPELVSTIYTFLLSFIIALTVYHIFLFIFGYKFLYLYLFGIEAAKKYTPKNLKI